MGFFLTGDLARQAEKSSDSADAESPVLLQFNPSKDSRGREAGEGEVVGAGYI